MTFDDLQLWPGHPIVIRVLAACERAVLPIPGGVHEFMRWPGPVTRGGGKAHQSNPGYPSVWVPEIRRSIRGHRLIYTAYFGDLPEGWHRDHRCGMSLCLNPMCLEAVTPQENARRRMIKDRALKNRSES